MDELLVVPGGDGPADAKQAAVTTSQALSGPGPSHESRAERQTRTGLLGEGWDGAS